MPIKERVMPRSSLISLPALFIPFSLLAAPEAVKVEVLQNNSITLVPGVPAG
jgi:hypothetical protein